MRLAILIATTIILASLYACHGTRDAPLASYVAPSVQPSGLSNIRTIAGIALPADLRELLAHYRLHILEHSHHLTVDEAQRYADAEVRSLTQKYSGRDAALQAEVVRRLLHSPVRPIGSTASPIDQRKVTQQNQGYPVDVNQKAE